jgi:hypothetical protein
MKAKKRRERDGICVGVVRKLGLVLWVATGTKSIWKFIEQMGSHFMMDVIYERLPRKEPFFELRDLRATPHYYKIKVLRKVSFS